MYIELCNMITYYLPTTSPFFGIYIKNIYLCIRAHRTQICYACHTFLSTLLIYLYTNSLFLWSYSLVVQFYVISHKIANLHTYIPIYLHSTWILTCTNRRHPRKMYTSSQRNSVENHLVAHRRTGPKF